MRIDAAVWLFMLAGMGLRCVLGAASEWALRTCSMGAAVAAAVAVALALILSMASSNV